MSKRHRVRALLIPLLAAAFLLAGQLPAFAPQAGSDAVVYPLAICRDGISFLFWADYYPAGTGDPDEKYSAIRVQSVQAATPVPPADANGRITPPANTLVLDTTVNVPYAPQQIDFATVNPVAAIPQVPATRRPVLALPSAGGPPRRQLRRWSLHAPVGPQAQGGAAVGGVELRPLRHHHLQRGDHR
jgi:hypothetical protein